MSDRIVQGLVLVFDAPDQATAELVCATLQAAGIHAVLQNQHSGPASGWLNYLGANYGRGVLVPHSQADAARSLLVEQAPTEEEIAAAAAADTTTTEEAEENLRIPPGR